MNASRVGILKKARNIGGILGAVWQARRSAHAGAAAELWTEIENGVDSSASLEGWHAERIVSPTSGIPYDYLHLPATCPDAPPMILLHGLFLDARNFLRFRPLTKYFSLYALYWPHQSPMYNGHTENFASVVQDFIDGLGVERIHLCGVSLGGMVAMKYACTPRKTDVSSLYLISTDTAKTEAALNKQRNGIRRALRLIGDDDDFLLCFIDLMRQRKTAKLDSEHRSVMALFRLKHPAFYRQVLNAGMNSDTILPLKNLQMPVIHIHGDSDTTLPYESAKRLSSFIPGSRFVTISGGEHDVAYTRADEVVSIISEFYQSQGK